MLSVTHIDFVDAIHAMINTVGAQVCLCADGVFYRLLFYDFPVSSKKALVVFSLPQR